MKTRVMIALLLSMFVALIGSTAAAPVRAAEQPLNARQSCSTTQPLAASVHRAGLVVTFGDRRTEKFCIEFSEDAISGLQLLERSPLPIVTSSASGLGGAVCAIGGEGSSDSTNCFASCTGGSCAYWAYYQFVSGAWKFSQVGASQHMVHDGDIEGWAWGPGGLSSGAVPEPPGEICPAPTAIPTAIPVATAAPTEPPAPSATPAAPSATDAAVPATVAPTVDAPLATPILDSTETAAGSSVDSGIAAVPRVTPQSAVRAEERLPASPASTARPSETSVTATPPSGVIVISAEQGSVNESHAEASTRRAGGSRTSLFLFSGIVVVLIAAGAAVVYRRRQLG